MQKELEGEIKGLEGIISCKIKGEGEIEEVHIIASRNREPKRIVRDIETMIFVNLDQEISHKKISIAQVDQIKQKNRKNRIEIISIHKENSRPNFHYKLEIDNNVIEEEIKGDVKNMPSVVVEGITEIIQDYTSFPGKIGIENVFTTGLNNELVVVQLLVYNNGNISNKERLVGTAYIDHNFPLATGKACLKALNRRLNKYL
jgi:hypothetical protein